MKPFRLKLAFAVAPVILTTVILTSVILTSVILTSVAFAQEDPPAAAPVGAFPSLPEPRSHFEGLFATSLVCALCHDNSPRAMAMRDAEEREVSPVLLWSSSPMASSFRDVIWRAVVSAEVADTPSRKADIQAKCLRCHAPMASVALSRDEIVKSLAATGDAVSQLALDGASCTVCHQVIEKGLGSETSFSGGYALGEESKIFGPHTEPFSHPMEHHSGYTPVHSSHVRRSSLCATCHTLTTDSMDSDGNRVGARFLEQAPYLEWRSSAFNDEAKPGLGEPATCQSCHMPTRDQDGRAIETRIAHNPGGRDWPPIGPRSPFGRHIFVGGNTLLPSLLGEHSSSLRSVADRQALRATERAAREQLRKRTARLEIDGIRLENGTLRFAAIVTNLCGHKLPTGHPARRAWLRIRVMDSDGVPLFQTGDFDADGRILGSDGKPLESELAGGSFQPHRARVTRPGETIIYELVMEDARGELTSSLLRAARARKDNRLLPRGWSPEHADGKATRPVGTDGDPEFGGTGMPAAGKDRVEFEIPLRNGARAPTDVEATLWYQTIGARYGAELFRHETPEVRALRAAMPGSGSPPEIVARVRRRVE